MNMTDETITKEKETQTIEETPRDGVGKADSKSEGIDTKRVKRPFKKNVRKPRRRERAKAEFDSKIVSIRRVTRVVSGGRRFSFSVSLVAGDRKGSVGVGIGKSTDTSLAIEKAMKDAKKNMVTLSLTPENSIPFDVQAKYTASDILIVPAPGKGLSAGSSVRTVLELAGITDITAKIFSRSKNQLNNARAAMNALKKIGYDRYQKPKSKFSERNAGVGNRKDRPSKARPSEHANSRNKTK
jgi:small subunit ribosomal protein S5